MQKRSIKSTLGNQLSQANIPINTTCKNATDEITNLSKKESHSKGFPFGQIKTLLHRIIELCRPLLNRKGVHSVIALSAAGFRYTDVGDTARCDACGLEVSGWTLEMKPFTVHTYRSPTCPYVRSIIPDEKNSLLTMANFLSATSEINSGEKPTKRQKIDVSQGIAPPHSLIETNKLKAIRKRTFSHWSARASPSSAQMIAAGFFGCNVGDRVICIYCDLICQQWTPNSDDPMEVHKLLSPKCPYIRAILDCSPTSSIMILNEHSANQYSSASNDPDLFRSNGIVFTNACHTAYIEVPRRLASFETWPKENLPSPEDLVRAGFYYTGTKTIVTCFYCNGSLQNWGANDNPMIEHARWFPHCAYIKQLCGPDLYRKVQESKQAHQERLRMNTSNQPGENINNNVGRGRLNIPDESTLSRYVAARLDLWISQMLLDKNFKLSVIKRCWEDQLRLKQDDFIDDCDLLFAATLLQKQIERIDGKKENITIPSVAMNNIRQKEQQVNQTREQTPASTATATNSSTNTEMEIPSTQTNTEQQKNDPPPAATEPTLEPRTDNSSPSNPCVLCLTEEKRLACIPCGHLATCVPCGHSLRSCPICRREIEAFVRIFI